MKRTWKTLKGLEKFLIFIITGGFNTVFMDPNQYKLVCLYLVLVQRMLHQMKAPQFYTNFLKLIFLEMQSSISEVEF